MQTYAAQITFNVNDAVAIVNSILAFVPKLAAIAIAFALTK